MSSLKRSHTLGPVKPSYGVKEAGCWFEGTRGIYIGESIIDLAIDHGFAPDLSDMPDCTRYSDYEYYHELTEEAVDFMQQFATDGFVFAFHEDWGDFGLYTLEED